MLVDETEDELICGVHCLIDDVLHPNRMCKIYSVGDLFERNLGVELILDMCDFDACGL